jgi:hypothetical protein
VSAAGEQLTNIPDASVEDPIKKAEQAEQEFPCQILDFVSNWQKGQKVTRKNDKKT